MDNVQLIGERDLKIAPQAVQSVELKDSTRVDLLDLVILQEIVDHVLLDAGAVEAGQASDDSVKALGERLLDVVAIRAIWMKTGGDDRRALVDLDRRDEDVDAGDENRATGFGR